MSGEVPLSREEVLLRELEKERRLRQQAEEEKQELENERHLRQQAEEENRKLKKQIQPTTLPEFLDACHIHLSVGFSTRINYRTGTQGNPENATSKLRPNYIREWTTFPRDQSKVWELLFGIDFVSEPHFSSLNGVKEAGKDIRLRLLGSELDLGYYERYAVEDRVAFIIHTLYSDHRLREIFNLKGKIMFENHGNTINSASDLDAGSPQQSPVQKRRKQVDPTATPTVQSRSSRPRADQFCVYNTGSDGTIPAFIIEYKAPHKLTRDIVNNGLLDTEVDEVVVSNENDDLVKLARRKVAAVITQAFSYMIQAKIEFGYICTGEVFIFLRIDPKDPTTVYYYLSIPNEDVGESTGWTSGSDGHNRLHLTAIGQVLAFTLQALRSPPHSQVWPENTEKQLKKWEIEHDDILFRQNTEGSSPPERTHSDYKPERKSRNEYIRMSPVRTRSKRLATASSCREPEEGRASSEPSDNDDSSENGGFDPSSPTARLSRPSSNAMVAVPSRSRPPPTERKEYTYNTGPINPWCTQKCLLGLRSRGPLDPDCPNVASHGSGRHTINDYELRKLVREQIIGERGPWGCESMHCHGTSGALFWITTFPYGYTLVAKAMPIETVKRAIYEENIYQHLQKIQGTYIPVCLGSIDISSRPLWYDGIFQVVHLLFLSHIGKNIRLHASMNHLKLFIPSACESLQAIHKQCILHRDTHIGNMFWNRENKRVMFIDFERAKIAESLTPTKKRKRETDPHPTKKNIEFERELRLAASNMTFR